jgi:hypothetical protein
MSWRTAHLPKLFVQILNGVNQALRNRTRSQCRDDDFFDSVAKFGWANRESSRCSRATALSFDGRAFDLRALGSEHPLPKATALEQYPKSLEAANGSNQYERCF